MTDFPCCEPKADPVIPDSLIDVGVAGIGTMETQIPSLSTFQAQAVVRAVLAAAIPHLRPLVEARWAQMYSDAVDNGNELAQELRQDLKVATEVALKLGRKEATEPLERLENEFRILSDPSYAHRTGATAWREAYMHAHECVLQEQQSMDGKDLMGSPLPARDTGKGDS